MHRRLMGRGVPPGWYLDRRHAFQLLHIDDTPNRVMRGNRREEGLRLRTLAIVAQVKIGRKGLLGRAPLNSRGEYSGQTAPDQIAIVAVAYLDIARCS